RGRRHPRLSRLPPDCGTFTAQPRDKGEVKMRGTLALAVTLAALAATAGAQTGATAGPGARQADEAITRALRANDMEAALRAYAEDAVFFPPGEMAQVGKAAIRRG